MHVTLDLEAEPGPHGLERRQAGIAKFRFAKVKVA